MRLPRLVDKAVECPTSNAVKRHSARHPIVSPLWRTDDSGAPNAEPGRLMTYQAADRGRQRTGYWFLWTVSVPTAGLLVLAVENRPSLIIRPGVGTLADLIIWTLVVAGVGLFPVPVSQRLHLKLNYPILLSVSM